MPPDHMSSSSTSPPSSTETPVAFKNSSSLYLITFLATLFLLLFVSCAIVLRSYILRRQYQRELDEAYAAGIVLAPRAQGSHRRRYGYKPKLHTLWVTQGGVKWRDMMPVSALQVRAKRRCKTPRSSSKQDQLHQQQPPSTPPSIWSRLLHGIPHDHITHPPTPTTSEKPSVVRVNMLQVSVLIAMPSPEHGSRSSIDKSLDEDSIPHVVFGVTRIPYKHNQI